MLLAALTLAVAVQTPPPLPREYQPLLIDPHHSAEGHVTGGASNNGFGNADLTPDGRLLLAYRRVDLDSVPASGKWPYHNALTATLVRPERFQLVNGHISSFKDASGDFVFGNAPTLDGDRSNDEFAMIHRGYEWTPTTSSDPDAIDVSGSFFPELATHGWVKLDPDYPIGGRWAGSHITMCLEPDPHEWPPKVWQIGQPLPPEPVGNPYPSNANGAFQVDGQYTTYKLFVVRLISENWVGKIEASTTGGEYFRPILGTGGSPMYPNGHELVSQRVTIVIDEVNDRIHATDVEPYEHLLTYQSDRIEGLEVSMTADGKLILFQGDVDAPLQFNPGEADVTYVYNKNAATSTGWTPVRSITELPLASELESGLTIAEFKERYKVFKNPIKIATPTGGIASHASGDHVRGAYTWISKDGSFFHATCGIVIDNAQSGEQSQGPGCRVGNYICGDITGGHIKYIDAHGITPTRNGIVWDWPEYKGPKDSQRNLVVSLGLKPGLWEGFLRSGGAPLPTTPASTRIPVLPLVMNTTDSYGEVRFEEADGNYLIYLACNEALVWNSALGPIGTECHEFSVDYTPDTSGRDDRAPVTLNAGAGFPAEVYGSSLAVQLATGAVFDIDPNVTGERFHENVGFKGQGIILNATGVLEAVQADTADPRVPRFMGTSAFTAQMFVKTLVAQPEPTATLELMAHGADGLAPVFGLNANGDGSFTAGLLAKDGGGNYVTLVAQSTPGYIQWSSDLDDCRDGWSHVAVTYDGTDGSTFELWIDGVLCATDSDPADTTVVDFPNRAAAYTVGPGAGGGSTVNTANAIFVVDEVAFSDVARTEEEIRRDAYVAPPASPFTDAPAGVTIPPGLEDAEQFWPIGVPHSNDIVDLGRDLFLSNDLSAAGDRSCATCHEPGNGFAEALPLAESTTSGVFLDFNTPTLLGGLFTGPKTFSGQAATLEDQVVLPLTNPLEMGAQSMAQIVSRLASDPVWNLKFTTAFGHPISQDNLKKALASYCLTLNTGNAPFDQEQVATGVLTDQERRGFELFVGKARCIGCHRPPAFTDGDFHNVQTVTNASLLDRGGFTGRVREDGALKTPQLRNLSDTGPYFHDGSKSTLLDVVEHYDGDFLSVTGAVGPADRFLRPLGLTAAERNDLVAFLEALDGSTPN